MAFVITKPLLDHQLEVIKAIESLRVIKNNAPINLGDINWDADAISRENINGKIVEISSKIELGITTAETFWKDSSNTLHSWATLAEYLLWLKEMAIAIAERNTSLYAACWTKKSAVMALTTTTEVVTYDINSGW